MIATCRCLPRRHTSTHNRTCNHLERPITNNSRVPEWTLQETNNLHVNNNTSRETASLNVVRDNRGCCRRENKDFYTHLPRPFLDPWLEAACLLLTPGHVDLARHGHSVHTAQRLDVHSDKHADKQAPQDVDCRTRDGRMDRSASGLSQHSIIQNFVLLFLDSFV